MDFSFTDVLTNTEYSVSDFKGKLVVIDFWATWCGPCVASIPEVRELQAKYSDKVAFIGVSLDQGTAEKFISFCEKNEMIWPQFFDKDATSALATKYSVFGIPTLFLLDREGKIITTEAREDLEGLIKANL
ncbi:MAG: TlpA family protein disulfide reductase [Spirochaetales bacterium]|nr:TlpA family protein disulfide reductase [Spirochaetales bacterium]